MSTWEDLKVVLAQLRDNVDGALRGFPDPDIDRNRVPPFHISLAPWATDVAADLYDRFGDAVSLTVGALRFPAPGPGASTGAEAWSPRRAEPAPRLPDELGAQAQGITTVRSGRDTDGRLLLDNQGVDEIVVTTNGWVTARVVDPGNGVVVGGFAGAQAAPRVQFRALPGETAAIPLHVGTASFVRALGYAVPPGPWAIDAVVDLEDGPYRTPQFPITVTA